MAGTVENKLNSQTEEDFVKDKRIACKYGLKCYQKNEQHLRKYKHPPKPGASSEEETAKRTLKQVVQPSKRPKRDDSVSEDEDEDDMVMRSDDEEEAVLRSVGDEEMVAKSDEEEGGIHEAKTSEASSTSGSPQHIQQNQISTNKPKKTEDTCSEMEESADCSNSTEPEELQEIKAFINKKFFIKMPDDFYSFWEFCKSLSGDRPSDALKDVQLQLVGPYDVLAGSIKVKRNEYDQALFLRHWRYYYDPPEFQTVLKGNDKTQFHIGYFRDEPHATPVFVASNTATKSGVITPMAPNIFGAVNEYLNDFKKSCTPFMQPKIAKYQNKLKKWAEDHEFTLLKTTDDMKKRNRRMVTRTFHGAGLVVPLDKKTDVGYRELMETDANLKRILRRIVDSQTDDQKESALDSLQPVITAANIANDECDFGTSVELGLDLFTYGAEVLDRTALQLLSTGYTLLGRKEFAEIAKAHLDHRVKSCNLNMFP